MLDDPTTADEPTDEPDVVQSTPEPDEATPETPEVVEDEVVVPPWGDDFDPERAWKTITHLRSREKELETAAKEYDRLKSDPDAQAKFLEQLGYELADDDEPGEVAQADDGDDDEPLDPLEQRLARIEALEAQRAEEAQTQRLVQYVEREFEDIGGNLTDDQRTFVLNHARLLPFTPSGMPDIKSAHVAYLEHVAALKKEWAGTKKAAPVSPVGTSGTQVPNLDNPKERHAWLQQQLAARSEDS